MTARKLLVLGGTGFVGRAFIQRWVAGHAGAGVDVLVPSRRPVSPAHPAARELALLPGVRLVRADVNDEATLLGLVAGCDAVVNLVAILHGSPRRFREVHELLPARLVAACAAAGVPQLLHISALGVSDEHPEALPSNYLRSKARGEQALRAGVAGSRTALTVLRPSVIFGADDRFLNLFAGLQALLPVMALAGSGARFQPVWVGDAAEAMVRLLRGPAGELAAATPDRPRVVEAAGPRVWTLGELVRAAGRWSGHARPVLPLPTWVGHLQAAVFGLLPGEPLMSGDNLRSMRVPNVATPGRAGLAALGIAPAEVADVMAAHLARR